MCVFQGHQWAEGNSYCCCNSSQVLLRKWRQKCGWLGRCLWELEIDSWKCSCWSRSAGEPLRGTDGEQVTPYAKNWVCPRLRLACWAGAPQGYGGCPRKLPPWVGLWWVFVKLRLAKSTRKDIVHSVPLIASVNKNPWGSLELQVSSNLFSQSHRMDSPGSWFKSILWSFSTEKGVGFRFAPVSVEFVEGIPEDSVSSSQSKILSQHPIWQGLTAADVVNVPHGAIVLLPYDCVVHRVNLSMCQCFALQIWQRVLP